MHFVKFPLESGRNPVKDRWSKSQERIANFLQSQEEILKQRKFSLKSGKNPETKQILSKVRKKSWNNALCKFSLKSGNKSWNNANSQVSSQEGILGKTARGSTHFRERSIPTEVEFSHRKKIPVAERDFIITSSI